MIVEWVFSLITSKKACLFNIFLFIEKCMYTYIELYI